jgi:hypothetical protein
MQHASDARKFGWVVLCLAFAEAGCARDEQHARGEQKSARTSEGLSMALEYLTCPNGAFVLDYNAPNPADWQRIAALPSKPAFIVVDDWGVNAAAVDPSDTSHAPGWFHTHPDPTVQQIRVIKYVPTNHSHSGVGACPNQDPTNHSLCDNTTMDASCAAIPITTRITRALQSGFDGIFFDETSSPASVSYVQDCAARVKDVWGDNKMVIINPGVNSSSIFAYYDRNIDIISVERHVETQVSTSGIPAIHWLAVEDGVTAESTAETDLNTFRNNGGFWYYGATHYSQLPDDTWLTAITNASSGGRPDCGCVTPDTRNLLANPGFTNGFSGWNLDSGSGTFSWTPGSSQDVYGNNADATSCSSSGSAYLTTPWDDSADEQRIWQCVNITPNTTYNFGAHILGQGSYAYCDLDLYTGGGCSGAQLSQFSGLWLNVWWSPDQRTQITAPSNTVSARVSCHIQGGGAAYFDTLYLTPAPGEY